MFVTDVGGCGIFVCFFVFVFPQAEPTSMARNRKFLNDLEKRTAKDFWIFVSCLYLPRIRQGHLAELILWYEDINHKLSSFYGMKT